MDAFWVAPGSTGASTFRICDAPGVTVMATSAPTGAPIAFAMAGKAGRPGSSVLLAPSRERRENVFPSTTTCSTRSSCQGNLIFSTTAFSLSVSGMLMAATVEPWAGTPPQTAVTIAAITSSIINLAITGFIVDLQTVKPSSPGKNVGQ